MACAAADAAAADAALAGRAAARSAVGKSKAAAKQAKRLAARTARPWYCTTCGKSMNLNDRKVWPFPSPSLSRPLDPFPVDNPPSNPPSLPPHLASPEVQNTLEARGGGERKTTCAVHHGGLNDTAVTMC